ncbi:hypothetical protein C5167_000978 [Papaver somniferum]|uniref:Bet v I/Major latex protein domain-containing protein n=1 Tax=Papaver somniferum TaxID=3469 RepID=A0A4Y7KWV7_PAPSO|nr:hypothetical protein C5167_000978 [Papaver somniferum]
MAHNLEFEYKAKCCAEELYAMMTRDAAKLPKYVLQMIHNVQILPGDGDVRVGSVFIWDYVRGDKPSSAMKKDKVTAVDHKNMSITFTGFEGELTNGFTSLSSTLNYYHTNTEGWEL